MKQWRRLVGAVVLLVLIASIGGDTWRPHAGRSRAALHGTSIDSTGSGMAATTTTTSRAGHRLRLLLAEYDRLYAALAGNPDIFYNPAHPTHRRLADLLTPDSPLRRPFIISSFDQDDPRHYVLRAGTRLLEPGERNAELPIVHEILGDLPNLDSAGNTIQVPICNHMHYTIFDRQMQGIEAAVDSKLPGIATFKRVNGEWRLFDYGWRWDRACERCGPEPPGTGHIATYIDRQTDERRPRPPDPVCPRQPRGTP